VLKTSSFSKSVVFFLPAAFLFSVLLTCCSQQAPHTEKLVGAWKGKVQFKTGVYSEIKDFEFMYVFNSGGTMTESSNYDGVPPTPPAYGIWKKTGDKQYEARYEFYWNKVPDTYEELAKAGGFPNAGHGVLSENITLSDDGKSYNSTLKFNLYDQTDKQTVFNEEGTVAAKRMEF
jgi:hypothetical protein